MKIKILKENGVEARNIHNSVQVKHYAKGSVVPIKKHFSNLFNTHFFDFDGYVFTLNGDEMLSV